MTTELQVVAQEAPAASKPLLAMLRALLREARSGTIQSLGVVYIEDGQPQVDYVAEEGDELTLASCARQLDEVIRADAFCED